MNWDRPSSWVRRITAPLALLIAVAVVVTPAPALASQVDTALPPAGQWEMNGSTAQLVVGDEVAAYVTVIKPGAQLETAKGCNMDVCIKVTGSGLVADSTEGWGKVASYRCVTWDIDANYTTIYRSPPVCADFGEEIYGWSGRRTFADGTRVCTAFRGVGSFPSIVGYPCITIHS